MFRRGKAQPEHAPFCSAVVVRSARKSPRLPSSLSFLRITASERGSLLRGRPSQTLHTTSTPSLGLSVVKKKKGKKKGEDLVAKLPQRYVGLGDISIVFVFHPLSSFPQSQIRPQSRSYRHTAHLGCGAPVQTLRHRRRYLGQFGFAALLFCSSSRLLCWGHRKSRRGV